MNATILQRPWAIAAAIVVLNLGCDAEPEPERSELADALIADGLVGEAEAIAIAEEIEDAQSLEWTLPEDSDRLALDGDDNPQAASSCSAGGSRRTARPGSVCPGVPGVRRRGWYWTHYWDVDLPAPFGALHSSTCLTL